MTEWQDFERAIINATEDTPLRLVAADWLEEQGDPRGEFIRVQCELARLGPQNELDPGQVEPDCDGCAGEGSDVNGLLQRVPCKKCWANLRARERELLADNLCNWTPLAWHQGSGVGIRLGEGATVEFTGAFLQSATFRRGFIESVSCRLADWIGGRCERCDGRGCYRYNSKRAVSGYRLETCRYCDRGRTASLGPLLVRAAPLLEVRFTDKRPLGSASARARDADGGHPGFRWTDSNHNMSWELPAEIFLLLPTGAGSGCCRIRDRGENRYTFSIRDYDTEAAAHAALSTILLTWARSQAAGG